LNATGVATLTTSFSTAGTNSITANIVAMLSSRAVPPPRCLKP
jgi:hypothetical protein